MKLPLFTISLLVTLIHFSLLSDTATSTPVYDTDGQALTPEKDYYILPATGNSGGGVRFNNSCPLYVAQANTETDNGLPVRFYPVDSNEETVPLSTDLNIDFFDIVTICVQSTVWQLGSREGDSGLRYVVAGGVIGNPGRETLSNWFKIENYGSSDYKLVFCPTVCDTCRPVCGDIGVLYQGSNRLLGLSNVSFPVVFKRKD